MNSPERACLLAKAAFDDALSGLDDLPDDHSCNIVLWPRDQTDMSAAGKHDQAESHPWGVLFRRTHANFNNSVRTGVRYEHRRTARSFTLPASKQSHKGLLENRSHELHP